MKLLLIGMIVFYSSMAFGQVISVENIRTSDGVGIKIAFSRVLVSVVEYNKFHFFMKTILLRIAQWSNAK
jgi:hypothetical protein